jgi:hypothetical protein
LTNEQVGRYLNDHFVSAFQKVGTFRIANGQKQGGNVASYFCLSDGCVLHVVAGPVDAATLLREARWVVETRKLAISQSDRALDQYKAIFRKAHADRLRQEYGMRAPLLDFPSPATQGLEIRSRKLAKQGRVHLLLAANPLVKIDKIYDVIFEQILGEKISTLPVVEKPGKA